MYFILKRSVIEFSSPCAIMAGFVGVFAFEEIVPGVVLGLWTSIVLLTSFILSFVLHCFAALRSGNACPKVWMKDVYCTFRQAIEWTVIVWANNMADEDVAGLMDMERWSKQVQHALVVAFDIALLLFSITFCTATGLTEHTSHTHTHTHIHCTR